MVISFCEVISHFYGPKTKLREGNVLVMFVCPLGGVFGMHLGTGGVDKGCAGADPGFLIGGGANP